MQRTDPYKQATLLTVRQSIVVGLGASAVFIVCAAISNFGHIDDALLGSVISLSSLLGSAAIYFWFGQRLFQQIGTVSSGAFGGFLAGIVAGLSGAIFSIIFFIATIDATVARVNTARFHETPAVYKSYAIFGYIVIALLLFVFSIIVGSAMGLLGSFVSLKRTQAAQSVSGSN